MPVKTVHFSENNMVYPSPGASTPSPSWSDSSLPSSPYPLTPPSLRPHGTTPLPPVPTTINPIIGVSTTKGYPPLSWDVSLRPETITPSNSTQPLPTVALTQPATVPPMLTLTLIHPHLPWQITFQPLSNGSYVSVGDVLHAFYASLRKAVTQGEFYAHPDNRRVSIAYSKRCESGRDRLRNEEERAQGVRRVDFLLGATRFLGLSSTKTGPNVWIVNTSTW